MQCGAGIVESGAGLDLHKNQRVLVAGENVDLAHGGLEAAAKDAIALETQQKCRECLGAAAFLFGLLAGGAAQASGSVVAARNASARA